MLGRPRHYIQAGLAGFSAATVAGALLIGARIGFFGWIGSIVVGYGVSAAVVRASARQRHSGIQATAAISTAAGLVAGALLVGLPLQALMRGPFLFPLVIAAGAAAFFAGRLPR